MAVTKQKLRPCRIEQKRKKKEKKAQMRIQVANEQYSQTMEPQTEETRSTKKKLLTSC
jgi:hypothetical protein